MSAATEDELELLERWAAGDTGAADRLFRRHYMSVRRFLEIKTGQSADDLTQRTFLACVEARDRFARASSFRTFLFGIARRQLLLYLRRGSRSERAMRLAAAGGRGTATTPSGLITNQQEQRLLVLALNALHPDLQAPLLLYYWEGMKGPEIAEVMDIPASTVRNRLSRARAELSDRIQKTAPARTAETLLANLGPWTTSLMAAGDLSIAFDQLVPVVPESR